MSKYIMGDVVFLKIDALPEGEISIEPGPFMEIPPEGAYVVFETKMIARECKFKIPSGIYRLYYREPCVIPASLHTDLKRANFL